MSLSERIQKILNKAAEMGYRRVIYLKSPRYDTLVKIKDMMEKYIEINSGFDKMRIQFDFNPM